MRARAQEALTRWRDAAARLPPPDEHSMAGISGGRTSALMAYLLPRSTALVFANTGREHSKTLDFLCRLEDDLQRPIVRVEFRAPRRGEPPKNATFEIVTHQTLSRKGEPFTDFLLCLASFRAKHKGLGPIAPWAASRICTSYLKLKTKWKLAEAWGWGKADDYTDYVGLRADEPERVAGVRRRNAERGTDERALLADLGIVKGDKPGQHFGVLQFWEDMPYDLGIPEHLGNCIECFLKDEGDLALALDDSEALPEWAFSIEDQFGPMRRGGATSYRQVHAEAPFRRRIRTALEDGLEPEREDGLPLKRHELLVKQERRRMKAGSAGFSCSCDAAPNIDDSQLLLGL